MFLSVKERLEADPTLRNFSNWPQITIDNIPEHKRKDFIQNCRIVRLVLSGVKYREISKKYNISPSRITQLLKRCLEAANTETPPLTRGCIPFEIVKSPKRRINIEQIETGKGAKCAFEKLLESVPGLREGLDLKLNDFINDKPEAENIKPADFHKHFLLLLREANHPTYLYPYTTNSLGYETLRKYMNRRLIELRLKKMDKGPLPWVPHHTKTPFYFFREIQIDEYLYDAQSTIVLELSEELIPLRVSRFAVVLASDADTRCRLAYTIVLNMYASQSDVLDTLASINRFSPTIKLSTPGLILPPGYAFPNQISPDFARLALNLVSLDNAFVHGSNSLLTYLCDVHGATRFRGYPGNPMDRNVVESAFRMLSLNAKRLNSTTGKNPVDPVRESRKNLKEPPAIRLSALEDAILVSLAAANNTPQAQLGGATPIATARHMMGSMPLRLIPKAIYDSWQSVQSRERVTLRWLERSVRPPHINFYYVRYCGRCLSNSEYISKELEVRFDPNDIRTLDVYSLDGIFLGKVNAPKIWQRFPHSLRTRRFIFQTKRSQRFAMQDPLTEYFWFQLKNKDKQKSALEIYRLYKEYTHGDNASTKSQANVIIDSNNGLALSAPTEPPASISNKVPAWSIDMALSRAKSNG